MANSSNKIVVPNAREAMDRFKMEAAGEVGVSLKQAGLSGKVEACFRDMLQGKGAVRAALEKYL